jgi:hypothetical protein
VNEPCPQATPFSHLPSDHPHLAKVDVEGSSPFTRFTNRRCPERTAAVLFGPSATGRHTGGSYAPAGPKASSGAASGPRANLGQRLSGTARDLCKRLCKVECKANCLRLCPSITALDVPFTTTRPAG